MKVCEAMIHCLEAEGVSVLFGYPGAAICPFYDALSRSSIRHILVRTEQNAAHAASGFSRISGKCGVCVATSGPGATNLISGIASAYMDSIPLVILTGQVNSALLGRDVFQEVDITGSVEPFIKHSFLVKNPAEICRVMKEAFYIAASGRPGPVLIDVPMDIQNCETRFSYPEEIQIRSYKPSSKGHPGQIKRAAEAICHADRPILCAGGGVFGSGAQQILGEFLSRIRMPAVHTLMGIGAIPHTAPLQLGMIGVHGEKSANLAIERADLLLLAGTRIGDRSVPNPELLSRHKKVIHIDIDPAEIGKNIPADIPVVGDLKLVLSQLLEVLQPLSFADWEHEIRFYQKQHAPALSEQEYVDPGCFFPQLYRRMNPDAILTADVGQNQIWAARQYALPFGRFLTSGGMGTMGYAIPAALGAKTAAPNRQVVAVCGDGSFQMSMMELATLCQHQIPVKLVVFVNRSLGMVRELQQRQYGSLEAVALDGSPDFVKLAEAYGIPALRATKNDAVPEALDAFFREPGTILLEVQVNPEEPTLPVSLYE
ncbi:MAG: biosynthetic-type acetolactate synthase large subunit [Candidatus Merdivicinus sp.]